MGGGGLHPLRSNAVGLADYNFQHSDGGHFAQYQRDRGALSLAVPLYIGFWNRRCDPGALDPGNRASGQVGFQVFSCVSVGSVAVITIYILVSGAPALIEIGVGDFLFGTKWEASAEVFGILPMILSSIAGTLGAIVIGVPIGLLTAIFLSETANPILAKIVRPAVELLAGIPSVIYGFLACW